MDKKKITEFFADKKSRRFIGLSALTFLGLIGALALQTVLGLIGALALQTVWLYNVYTLIKNDIQKECTSILDAALYEEANLISKKVPEGTIIGGGAPNDSLPINTYIYEGITKLGIRYSLNEIDSLVNLHLCKRNLKSQYVVCVVNPYNENEIFQKSQQKTIPTIGSLKTSIIPIRINKSLGIQLILTNPHKVFFERMGFLIFSTLIILSFVIACIIYQIRIIAQMNKIFQIREDFTYAMIHDMKTPLSTIFTTLSFTCSPSPTKC